MHSSKNSDKIFSSNPFKIIKDYQNRCENVNSFNFINDENPRNEVQERFSNFCQLIYQEIPDEIALNDFKPTIHLASEKLVVAPTLYQRKGISLYTYLDIFSILYIELNDSCITIGFLEKAGEVLAEKMANLNPIITAKILAKNISLFQELGDSNISWNEEEILYLSINDLLEQFNEWFEEYIPLLWLAVSDKIIPSVSRYINDDNPIYWLYDCVQDTGLTQTELERWIQIINRKKQVILYGSPGTGKTYIAEKLAKHLIGGGDGFSELVQFHPAYSYEDFIQGIRPQSQDGKLTYPLVPGRFLEFCKKAESRQDTCVLIIDEINRANLAQVFGELMYLLEYRDREIPLAAGNTFRIPDNVRIIGTMNTADRSIAQIDHALRRRFAFIELRPNYDVLRQYHLKTGVAVEDLIKILQELNQAIADKNYEIGISFFLTENLRGDIQDIWQMEIEPYLEEYFFNQLDKVDEFRWDKINKRIHILN